MRSIELYGIPCEIQTEENLSTFRKVFDEVYSVLVAKHFELWQAVAGWLKQIVYTDCPTDRLGRQISGVCDNETQSVRFVSEFFSNEETAGYIVCHELRHCFQFATQGKLDRPLAEDEQESLRRLYLHTTAEADATAFAAACGFPRAERVEFNIEKLPDDPAFRNVTKCWPFLSEEQRQAFSDRAGMIRATHKQFTIQG